MGAENLAEALRNLREAAAKEKGKAKLTRVESLFEWLSEVTARQKRIRETYGSRLSLNDGFLLLFVGLKLGGFIHWGWPWVLAPLWIGIPAFAAAVAVAALLDAFFPREGVE